MHSLHFLTPLTLCCFHKRKASSGRIDMNFHTQVDIKANQSAGCLNEPSYFYSTHSTPPIPVIIEEFLVYHFLMDEGI